MPIKYGSSVDMNEFQAYLDLDRFKVYLTAVSQQHMLIATEKYLLLSSLPQDHSISSSSMSKGRHVEYPDGDSIDDASTLGHKLVLEFKDTNEKPSCLTWIEQDVFCIGFTNGLLLCFDIDGNEIFQFKGSTSDVQAIRMLEWNEHLYLWVLYSEALLLMVPLNDAFAHKFQDVFGFTLQGQEESHDFLLYPHPYAGRNEWEDLENNQDIHQGLCAFVVGFNHAICIYDLDMKKIRKEQRRQMSSDKSSSSSSTSSSITKSIFSYFSYSNSSSTGGNQGGSTSNGGGSDKTWKDGDIPTWSKTRMMALTNRIHFHDTKRRILRISMDPFQSYIAMADTLGRVTLFDIQAESIIRIWKGVRDAYLGWNLDFDVTRNGANTSSRSRRQTMDQAEMESATSSTAMTTSTQLQTLGKEHLKLMIYAPLLGLISIYQMRHGPCIRVIPVGMNCKLANIFGLDARDNFSVIQSAVPLRAEVEHQAIDVLSIYQQDLPESELALIANMLEGEDNQGDVDGFEQGEEYSVESKHGQEDGELRHTDMRHSIQEVLQHKQQNTKVYHDVMILDELTRLLRTMSADKKPTLPSAGGPGGLTRTESRILELLSHTSFKSLSRVLAILELAELSGFQVDAGLERHRDYVVKSMKMSSYGEAASKNMLPMIQCNCKKYSTAFHQQVNVILAQKLQQYQVLKTQPSSSKTHRSSGNSVQGAPSSTMNLLQSELEIRQRLLLAYEKLSEIHEIHIASEAQASSHANNGNMNSPMRDDATTLCRQNNYRAEALCWTLRQVKKLEHVQHHHQVGMRSGPSSPMLASTATSPMHPSGTLSPMNNRQSMASSVSGVTSNSTSNTNISANLSQSVVPTFRSDSIVVLSDTTANSGSNSNSGRHALSPKPLGKVENKSTVLHNLSASTASDTTTTAPAPQSPGRKATSSFVPHDLNPGSNSSTHEALEFMNFSMFRIFHGERNDVESTSSTKNISFTIRIDDIADILTQANTLGSSEQHVMEHSSLTITNFCSVDIMHFYNTGAGMNTNKTDGAEDQEVGGDEEEEEEDHDSSRMDFIEVSLSHPQIALYMLIYFFQPLLSGDLVVYRGFTTALKYEGHVLSGPQALKELLPGFLHYISAQSLSVVVDELLTKKLSTSPFQRWIRDHLLTFQDMVSSYNTHLRKQFSSLESANHEPSATQIVVDDDEEELDEEELHMRKVMADMRQEVIAQRKQNIALLHAASSTSSSSHQEIPSFDEYVRYLLLPVWLECRRCTQLEYVLSFASIIVETLSNVHEQIERRTYGADHLKKTIQSWEILIKQIRVVLFLKSRMYRDNIANASADQAQYNNTSIASLSISLYTVENMSEGKLSLGRILAMDTLEFALRADQAIEHEERCREVYHKRKASLLSAPGGNAAAAEGDSNNASKSEVLLAWGPVADRRWRDILSVAVMEDSLDASSTPAGSGALDSATSMNKDTSPDPAKPRQVKRRRKPLLLFFPEHNQSIFLGAYRSLVLAERWYKKVDSMELLAVVCEHLFELTPEWRGVIALQIYRRFIFPILQAILALEEELLDTDGSMLKIPTEIAKRNQILSLMGEAVLFKSFTGLVTEILNYVLEIIPQNTAKYEGSIADLSSIPLHLSSVYNLAQGSSNSPVMYEEDVSYLAFRDSTDLYMERLSSNASNTGGGSVPSPTAASGGSSNSISQVSPTLNGLSWPVLADKYMSDMFVAFYTPHFASTHATNNTESGAKGNASKAPSTPFPSSSRHNRKAVAKEDMIWSDKSTTREIMLYHIAVFYVMQLRFQCGLRGLKPSQLLGKHPLQEIITTNRMYGMSISKTSQLDRFDEDWRQMRLNQFVVDDVLHIRTEFLAQGFMRLANVEFPAVLYTLATSLWGFDTDTIRLLHIRALLTNGDHDNEIEEMVPQFDDMTLVLDLLISSCRERLGQLLLQMEKIPAYGPMLAAMDAEALQWVKQFPSTASIINATASSNSAANNAGNGGGMSSGGSEKASGQGGIVTAKSKSSGNISSGAVVQVDISSIRRLTIFLQSILITVPIKDRDVLAIAPGSNTQASAKILAIASLFGYIRYTSWIERKSRCDALLSLCNAMVPLSAARKKTSSIGSSAELNAGQRARSNSHNVNQG